MRFSVGQTYRSHNNPNYVMRVNRRTWKYMDATLTFNGNGRKAVIGEYRINMMDHRPDKYEDEHVWLLDEWRDLRIGFSAGE